MKNIFNIDWESLLCDERKNPNKVSESDYRDCFENDYDRLIYSPVVRRLQNKTQVVPLPKSDYIRNRLTHSHEVSSIGKSLAISVGNKLKEKDVHYFSNVSNVYKFGNLLRVLGLVHDLGNPPFGHFGEVVINRNFKNLLKSDKFKLSDLEKFELQHFDGNTQTIRIINQLSLFHPEINLKGANVTYTTMVGLIKYPFKSSDWLDEELSKTRKELSKIRIGVFQDDEIDYKTWINKIRIEDNHRHPATFLLEAADDIAYIAADIEDGVKAGFLGLDDILDFILNLQKLIENNDINNLSGLKSLNNEKLHVYKKFFGSDYLTKFSALMRVELQKFFINKVVESFCNDEIFRSLIINPININLDKIDLIEKCDLSKAIRNLTKGLMSKIFKCNDVIRAELNGAKAIEGLINQLVSELFPESKEYNSTFETEEERLKKLKLYNISSESYRIWLYNELNKNFERRDYLYLRFIQDYISGMTDKFCLNLYKDINGIS